MTSKVKKIGMIGAGWVSKHHLNAYQKLQDQAQVVAIADPSAVARNTRVEEYGIERAYADAGEMLEQESLDAVDITSPRQFHAEHVLMAVSHNLPTMCQKPLAKDFAEAKALVTTVGEKVRIMVHENWRWRPHYRQIHRWINGGFIGEPLQTSLNAFTSGLLPDNSGKLPALTRQPMMKNLDQMLLMEVLIHHVDSLRFLLGDLELESSRMGKVCKEIAGEDNATLYMRSKSDGSVILTGNFSAHGYPSSLFDDLEIIGETGTIRLHGDQLELIALQPQSIKVDLDADYEMSYHDTIKHFLDCLCSGRQFETWSEDNLKTLEIVDKVYGTYAS
jgi:predicted dehydrogenase